MLRLPFMAGTTESDHSLRSRDIGEAVCRITWTPVGFIIMARQTRGGEIWEKVPELSK